MNSVKRLFVKLIYAGFALTLSGCVAIRQVPDDNILGDIAFEVVPRESWGWQDGPANTVEHRVQRITIHHGGIAFADDRDPVDYLRGLQSWSRTDKGWTDIPYHFVIDLQGKVYEARPLIYPGDTNTSYDPTGHALVQIVGDYEKRTLASVQLKAIIRLSAMLVSHYDIPIADIRGHLDYAPGETVCPGDNIYQYLRDGTITNAVSDLLAE